MKFRWARFELGISFFYTLASTFLSTVYAIFINESTSTLTAVYNRVVERGAHDYEIFGPDFPLAMNYTAPDAVRAAINVFYSVPETLVVASCIIGVVQVAGIYVCLCVHGEDDTKASRLLRIIICLTATIMCIYWPFGIYLSFYLPGPSHIFLIFTLPALIQFLFGIQSAMYTNILPVFTDKNDGSAESESTPSTASRPWVTTAFCIFALIPFGLVVGWSINSAVLWVQAAMYWETQSALAAAASSASRDTRTVLLVCFLIYVFIGTTWLGREAAYAIGNAYNFVKDQLGLGPDQGKDHQLSVSAREKLAKIEDAQERSEAIRKRQDGAEEDVDEDVTEDIEDIEDEHEPSSSDATSPHAAPDQQV